MYPVRCAYANIGSAQSPQLLHYRAAGDGPALVMLHASPLSSAALLPVMQALAGEVTTFALDTPGYGQSDPPGATGPGLEPYVEALERWRAALSLDRFGLYGTATGAQIGIEYAKAHPERVAFLLLDNAADFTQAVHDTYTNGYFPDLAPDAMGSHLVRAWSVARDQMLFFPWHLQRAEYRLPAGAINPELLDGFARLILEAGPDYARAYRAAFANERASRLLEVPVPTTIIRWAGSILKTFTDRFDQYSFPDNFQMQPCGPTPAERFEGLLEAVRTQVQSNPGTTTQVSNFVAGPRGYHDGHHWRRAGTGRPLLILHELGGSAATVEPLLNALAPEWLCYAPDLPGHGASAPAGDRFVAACMDQLDTLLELLGPDTRLLAVGDSAALACHYVVERQLSTPPVLVNPLPLDADPRATLDLRPRASGSHWLEAWAMLRQRQLFFPWYLTDPEHALAGAPNLSPPALNTQWRALLAAAPALAPARQATARLPLPPDAVEPVWIALSGGPLGAAARRALPHVAWQEWDLATPNWQDP